MNIWEKQKFSHYALQSQRDIVNAISQHQKELVSQPGESQRAPLLLLGMLVEALKTSAIPSVAKTDYAYEVNLYQDYAEINLLKMEHVEWAPSGEPRASITEIKSQILEVRAPYLTLTEYAEKFQIEPVTVRQWIRRGKLRNAVKRGGEWQIPSTQGKPPRGFSDAVVYGLDKSNIGQRFPELTGAESLTLAKEGSSARNVVLSAYDENGKCIYAAKLDTTQREQLELELISDPEIWYDEEPLVFIDQKDTESNPRPLLKQPKSASKNRGYSLCVESKERRTADIYLGEDPRESLAYSEDKSFLFQFYWEIYREYYSENDENPTRESVGSLWGHIIDAETAELNGYDIYEECDAKSGTLEWLMATLTSAEGPMDEITGSPDMVVMYIDEITLSEDARPKYAHQDIDRVLYALPQLCAQLEKKEPTLITHLAAPRKRNEQDYSGEQKLNRIFLRNGFERLKGTNLYCVYAC